MCSVNPKCVRRDSNAERYLANAAALADCSDEGGGIQFDLLFESGRDLVDHVVQQALREA
jgi:hypothetical protein